MSLNILNGLPDRCYLGSLPGGDRYLERFLKAPHEFDNVLRAGAELIDESCLTRDTVLMHTKLRYDNLRNAFFDTHGQLLLALKRKRAGQASAGA